jgi:hypothetical protein
MIFDTIKENNIEWSNHCSDLYIPVNHLTRYIVSQYQYKQNVKTFISQIDGKLWYDIPFAYYPFFEK